MKTLSLFITLAVTFCHNVYAQDLDGNPLPDSIPQDVHDQVVENSTTYGNWIACGHTLDVCGEFLDAQFAAVEFWATEAEGARDALMQCQGELDNAPPPPPMVACDTTSDFRDGAFTGALWKPVSENTGDPVFLLPSDPYQNSIDTVEVFSSAAEKIVNGRFRTCCPNGGRTHWDVPFKATDLDNLAPIIVRLNLVDGTKECRTVDKPSERQD